jgi:predicted esterase
MSALAAHRPVRRAGCLLIALVHGALLAGGEGAPPLPEAAAGDAPGLALAAGLRLRCVAPEYAAAGNDAVAHLVALPQDWVEGRRYPVLVEYAPNRYQGAGAFGPLSCAGTTADCRMGFYLAGAPGRPECGVGYLWVCMPLIACDRAAPDDLARRREAIRWWGAAGDGPAVISDTVGQRLAAEYLRANLPRVCARFGGDPGRVALLGFSRGAIAGGWIGRSDDATAALFRAFVLHSWHDGMSDPLCPGDPGQLRLRRALGRPSFLSCGERDHGRAMTEEADRQLRALGADSELHVVADLPHSDEWVLGRTAGHLAVRDAARAFLARATAPRP